MRRRRISMLLSLAAVFVLLLIGVPTPAAATGPSGPIGETLPDLTTTTPPPDETTTTPPPDETTTTPPPGGDSGGGGTGGGGGGGGDGGVIIVDPPPTVGDPTPIPTDEVGPWDRTGQGQDKGFFGDPSTGGQASGGTTQVGGTTTASAGAAIGQFVPSWLLSLPGFEGAALSAESASVLAAAATILAGGEGAALDGTSVGGVTFPSELAWDIATAPARYGLTPTSATGPFGNIKYLGIPALILGALALLLIVASSRNIEDLASTARHPHAHVS